MQTIRIRLCNPRYCISTIDEIEDNNSLDALIHQFTLEQSSAVNEKIRLERFIDDGLLLEETDGDFIIGEDDSTSVGESILLENGSFLINEDYIIGDKSVDKNTK